MPRIGAHMSIAGGLHLAFERLATAGGDALQIFSRNQRQWTSPPITPEAARLFKAFWRENGRPPVAIHDSYLTNLASPDPATAERSIAFFADELRRADMLGIPSVVTHPGSHLGTGVKEGIARYAANLDRSIELAKASSAMILMENTAGQGSSLGSDFNELADIIGASRHPDRLGICLDTCHAFAAGYDLRSPDACEHTFMELDRIVGLDRLRFFHLNDSKRELGSRIDRHEHIGQGLLGIVPFAFIVNDPRFTAIPMVIETPKDKALTEDIRNIALLRSLIANNAA